MIEDFKTFINLQVKKLEISYKTWKNARDIAKAYNKDQSRFKIFLNYISEHSRTIIAFSLITIGILGLSYGIFVNVKHFKYINSTKPAVMVKKEHPKTAPGQQKNDTVINFVSKRENSNRDSISFVKNEQKVLSTKKADDKKTAMQETEKKQSFFQRIKSFLSRMNYKPAKTENVAVEKQNLKKIDTALSTKQEAVIATQGTSVKPADTFLLKPVHQFTKKKSLIKADYYILVANKADRFLYLLVQNTDQEWTVIKEFPIAIGAGLSGPKISAGDKRTPEGIYFILLRKNRYELNEIYGPLAYILNYPNEIDKKEGRTGQGIWIHGTQGDGDPVPTKGCLSLSNVNMVEVSSFIKDGKGTPVVIVNDSLMNDPVSAVDFEKVHSDRINICSEQEKLLASVNEYLSNWIMAWESRDIEKYQDFYSKDGFNSMGMDWEEWKVKKIQTFQNYKTIDVSIDKISLSDWTEKSLEVTFLQHYKSDQKYFENGKKLFLEKDSSTWKIIREINIPKEELLL